MTVFVSIATADIDVKPSELEPFFFVNQDDPALGGCTPAQTQWLQIAYREAIVMIRGAMKAIDDVKMGRDLRDTGKQQQWDKTSAMLIEMFDIHFHPLAAIGIRDSKQQARLNAITGEIEDS